MKQPPRSELEFLKDLGVFGNRLKTGWVGPGDDGAVIPPVHGSIAFAADLLVEGVHFRRTTAKPEDAGYKALAVNVSDMAAMGAKPLAATLTLTLPEGVDQEWYRRLYVGLAQAEKEFGCPVVGGDLSKGSEIAISIAVIGECQPRGPLLRSTAQPGHLVLVTGRTGESGAGFLLLERGLKSGAPFEDHLVKRHLRPTPRTGFGLRAARNALASSMIDVSDGVTRDAQNIATASGVMLTLDSRLLKISDELRRCGEKHGLEPLGLALGGGEDYELLLTAHEENVDALKEAAKAEGIDLTVIGSVSEGEGVAVLGPDGAPMENFQTGFDHFK